MQIFKQNINSFLHLLEKVNAATISNNAYAVQYLQYLIEHKNHYVKIYTAVLELAFADKKISATTLLDFGTGNGLLALFAKYCGVKKVYASDVNNDFLQAAQQLSKQLNIEIDGWILGDENVLQHYFQQQQCHVIVGTDVIEHIYNLDYFFSVVKKMNVEMTSVFTTASVAENYFKSTKLKQLQLKDELKDSNAFQSSYQNEYAGLSFLAIRKKIIQNYNSSLSLDEVENLAKLTRGLNKNDIETAVNNFIKFKKLPQLIHHPTNTCDPITGSFTERLLYVKEYATIYQNHQFTLQVKNGFYNNSESGVKSLIATMLNFLIVMLGKYGRKISPFILLKGFKA